jgi:hypothetical protein
VLNDSRSGGGDVELNVEESRAFNISFHFGTLELASDKYIFFSA